MQYVSILCTLGEKSPEVLLRSPYANVAGRCAKTTRAAIDLDRGPYDETYFSSYATTLFLKKVGT